MSLQMKFHAQYQKRREIRFFSFMPLDLMGFNYMPYHRLTDRQLTVGRVKTLYPQQLIAWGIIRQMNSDYILTTCSL